MSRVLSLIDEALQFVQNYEFEEDEKKTSSGGGTGSRGTRSGVSGEEEKEVMWPAKRVRQTFIDFFTKKHGHTFMKSSSVVPLDDPTLLFTNAGMNQFKPIFLGDISSDDPLARLKRACNSQKCIRAGGKHNDLEDVGFDTYHHTFFEMLGNWSFGDYFKKEAIAYAWELLVEVYGLDQTRLYATYFGGNEEMGLEPDNEARELWLQYLPPSRVLPFGMKDNFWEMGAVGPCGPCTEIHYDRIGEGDVSGLVNADDPNVIEIWNLVFIQFNREEDGSLKVLPSKHIDTGMGFERLTSVLQDKLSNYDTDVFEPIMEAIYQHTNAPHRYTAKLGEEDQDGVDMAYRVIADHIRTLTFSICDGAQPDTNGRDYVLRSILRRAIRYGKEFLNAERGFFAQLVDCVVDHFGEAFPELTDENKVAKIKNIIDEEEYRFRKTLENGVNIFKSMFEELRLKGLTQFPGEYVFKLKTSFGFPPDLTAVMCRERGMDVDLVEFERLMSVAKEESSKKSTSSEFRFGEFEKNILQKDMGITEGTNDTSKYEWKDITDVNVLTIYNESERQFIGELNMEVMKSAQMKSDDVSSNNSDQSRLFAVILEKTNFYAEGGGQVGDIGELRDLNTDALFVVNDTQEFGGFVLHIGELHRGCLKSGCQSQVECCVDYDTRRRVAPNHSMTHVLNFALRKVLGDEADQRGSLVDADKTRFDFAHSKQLTYEEIEETQRICNDVIKQKLPLYTDTVPYEKATSINSLRCVFGERYPTNVRVVSVGAPIEDMLADPSKKDWLNFSVELCGGTHISNTSEAGDFRILTEEPVSGGVRRLVAVTGAGAESARYQALSLSDEFDRALAMEAGPALTKECSRLSGSYERSKIDYLTKVALKKKLDDLNEKDKAYKSQRRKALTQMAKQELDELAKQALKNQQTFVVVRLDVGLERKALQDGMKLFDKKTKNTVALFVVSAAPSESKNKVLVMATVPKKSTAAAQGLSAKEWVTSISDLISGGGGGNAAKASAQGTDHSRIADTLQIAIDFAQSKLQ